jgi:hypothetical protein
MNERRFIIRNKAKTLKGYKLDSLDGEIGKIKEFYFDDQHSAIRYLVADTQNWWPGKKVLVSPRWIESVSWNESKVFVNLSRATIKRSPEYAEGSPLSREYKADLHRHYNRQGYWVDEPVAKKSR